MPIGDVVFDLIVVTLVEIAALQVDLVRRSELAVHVDGAAANGLFEFADHVQVLEQLLFAVRAPRADAEQHTEYVEVSQFFELIADQARDPIAGDVFENLIRRAAGGVSRRIDARGIVADRFVADRTAQLLGGATRDEQVHGLCLIKASRGEQIPGRMAIHPGQRQRNEMVLTSDVDVIGFARDLQRWRFRRKTRLR